MTKNCEKRLGCVPGIGEVAINKHPFFASIDWRKLEHRQVSPPFQPEIVSVKFLNIFEILFHLVLDQLFYFDRVSMFKIVSDFVFTS